MWLFIILLFAPSISPTRVGEFVINYSRDCGDKNSVIRLKNSSIAFTDQWDLLSSTCSYVRAYRTAEMNTKLTKDVITIFDGKFNVCSKKRREFLKILMGIFGIPMQCPVQMNGNFCFNQTLLSTFSESTVNFIPTFFAGGNKIAVKSTIKHDTGTSCFEAEFSLK